MAELITENQEWPVQKARFVLTLTTVAFAICFACWVINAMLVTHLTQNDIIDFSAKQVGWLIAVPILSGAISRVPLGILTDIYGGRIVMTLLMITCAIPMYLLSVASTFNEFLLCSLGFGLAGGAFAVGVGYVSCWFQPEKQGTALGIFGMGNAGAAITTLAAPSLLTYLAINANPLEAWRQMPQIYAAVLIATAIVFYLGTEPRLLKNSQGKSLAERLSPMKSPVVWRFGLYYALVFGAFVSMTQWLVPYSVNVYQISLAQAGILAAVFSIPSGAIRAIGGWLSDRYGARSLMYTVFLGSAICCAILAIPKMNIVSPGVGISAKSSGIVDNISADELVVGGRSYAIAQRPDLTANEADAINNKMILPKLENWQEANVSLGTEVEKGQLIARGVSNVYYPANFWVFCGLVFVFGVLTGIGKAGVFKYIPDQFPDNVGTVGGIVGLIGALGGFALPMIFGYLLDETGLWTTCWIVLTVLSIVCLVSMQMTVNRLMQTEAPNLANLIESSAGRSIPTTADHRHLVPANVEALLKGLPFFHDLTHEELHELATIGEFKSSPNGETIFKQGDPGDALYVLITGRVKIFTHAEDENLLELVELTDGAYFGDLALIDGRPRSATVQTIEDCEFFLVGRQEFLKMMTNSPRILADVLIGLSEHVRNTNQLYVDINEKKEKLQVQAELDRHQSIAQMVTGVAHEINTPLGIVIHAASIIAEEINKDTIEELAKDEDAEEVLQDVAQAGQLILSNIQRADKLITSFKNLSVRQITDQIEELSLSEIVNDVLSIYQIKSNVSKLSLIISDDLDANDLWIGYPGPLGQVLMNLVSNIERYAYPEGDGGKVEIGLSKAGDLHPKYEFAISIRDFGIGLEKEEQSKVFDAFYTTGRAQGGSGIGLSVVYNLVTFQLSGKIVLESKPGDGCLFTVYLPKQVEEKQQQTHLIQGDAATA
jgi:NNP family nitrate/nitrite transporter-like MFS transporter